MTPIPARAGSRAPLIALGVVLAANAFVLAGWLGWIVLTIPGEVEGAGGLVRLAAVLVATAAVTASLVIGGVVVAVRSGRAAAAGGTGLRAGLRLGAVAAAAGLVPIGAVWLASALLG